jgi:hypothetical protein
MAYLTEQPGTTLFQRYARCPWTLPSTESANLTYTSTLAAFTSALSPVPGDTKGYTDDNLFSAPTPAPASATIERPGSTSGKKKKKKSQSPANGEQQLESQNEHIPDKAESTTLPDDADRHAMLLDRTVEGGLDGVMGLGMSRE